ncbi:MAG: hypothetical protein AAF514_12520, partial [Verrucomicrobiota bacterium]
MDSISRRTFLGVSSAAFASSTGFLAPLAAIEPIDRKGDARLLPSLAAYSFRELFKDKSRMDMVTFIDYCADHGLTGTELTSYYFPENSPPDYYLKLRRQAHLRGISPPLAFTFGLGG